MLGKNQNANRVFVSKKMKTMQGEIQCKTFALSKKQNLVQTHTA